MEKDLAEFAVKLALKQGVDYAEARLEKTEGDGFRLDNGRVVAAAFDTSMGIGIRIIKDGAVGFISSNELNKKSIESLVKHGIRNTHSSQRLVKEKTEFSEEPSHKKKYAAKEKIKLANVDVKEKLSLLLDIEKDISKSGINVPNRVMGFSTGIAEKYYFNSEGSEIYSRIPIVDLIFLFTVLREGKPQQRFLQKKSTTGWEIIKKWDLRKEILDEINVLDKILRTAIKPPSGIMDVVCGPEVTGIACHESVGHPYEADRILGRESAQAGESFVRPNMIGKKISIPEVNVVDDPTVPGSPGFYLFDDEGVKARRRYLIEKGRISELLHNRETAKKMGIRSNGSARAEGYNKEPIVRMANTFCEPGDHSLEELLEDVKKGIYVRSFMEWNIDDRRINAKYVGSEAYLIEKGELGPIINNPVIEISTLSFWGSIDAVGKDIDFYSATCGKGEPMQGVPVWTGGPSLRLRGIRLGAKR